MEAALSGLDNIETVLRELAGRSSAEGQPTESAPFAFGPSPAVAAAPRGKKKAKSPDTAEVQTAEG